MPSGHEALSLQEAARLLSVHEDTLINWYKTDPPMIQLVKLGHLWRVPVSEITRLSIVSDENLIFDESVPVKRPRSERLSVGYVYLIHAAQPGVTKIGVAANLRHRLVQLRIANAVSVDLILQRRFDSYMDAVRFERSLHVRFASVRQHGEWFRLTPTDLVIIRDELGFEAP